MLVRTVTTKIRFVSRLVVWTIVLGFFIEILWGLALNTFALPFSIQLILGAVKSVLVVFLVGYIGTRRYYLPGTLLERSLWFGGVYVFSALLGLVLWQMQFSGVVSAILNTLPFARLHYLFVLIFGVVTSMAALYVALRYFSARNVGVGKMLK